MDTIQSSDNLTTGFTASSEPYNSDYVKMSVSMSGNQKTSTSVDAQRIPRQELESIYKRLPLVFRAVNTISNFTISNGYHFESEQDSIVEEVTDFDSRVGMKFILTNVVRHANIYGNSYTEIIYDKYINGTGEFSGYEIPANGAVPVNLAIIDPKTMDFIRDEMGFIKLDEDGQVLGFVQTDPKTGHKIKLASSQIMHYIINGVADTIEGMGVIEPMYKTLTVHSNIEDSLGESIYRHGFPQFQVKIGDEKHQPTQPRINAEKETYKDFNQKSTFVTPYYHDIKMLESGVLREASNYLDYFVDIIVTTTGVPKSVLGIRGKSGWDTNSIEQQNFIIYIQSIQEQIGELLEKNVFSRMFGPNLVDVMFEPISSDDEETMLKRAQKHKIYYDLGAISIEDIREELGYERDRVKGETYIDGVYGSPDKPEDTTPDEPKDSTPIEPTDVDARVKTDVDTSLKTRKTISRGGTTNADIPDSEPIDGMPKIPLTKPMRDYASDLDDYLIEMQGKVVPKVRAELTKLTFLSEDSYNFEEMDNKDFLEFGWVEDLPFDDAYLQDIHFKHIKKSYVKGMEEATQKIPKGINVPRLPDTEAINFLKAYSFKVASTMNVHIKSSIKNALVEGIKEGDSLYQIKRRVSDVFSKGGNVTFPAHTVQYHTKPKDFLRGVKYVEKKIPRQVRFVDADARNKMIAKTEIRRATQMGRLDNYQKAGFKTVVYRLSGAHNVIDICDDWEGVTLDIESAKGKDYEYEGVIPQHPNCMCYWDVDTKSLGLNNDQLKLYLEEMNANLFADEGVN